MFLEANKEINRLISKKMSNISLNSSFLSKLTFSKLWFSESKKFVCRSVFGKLQLTKTALNLKTFGCTSKIRGLGTKACVVFYYLNFERNYEVLTLFQVGLFRAAHGNGKSVTHILLWWNLAVIPYLKKISCDKSPKFR